MNRRTFLKIAGGFLTGAAAGGLLKPQDLLAGDWADTWVGAESSNEGPLPEMSIPAGAEGLGAYCPGILRLKSAIHGEAYEFKFRDSSGNYDEQVLASLNWFLRCKDGSWQYMDLRAVEALNYLSAVLGVPVIQIISAYRSPRYNAKLALSNENVARNSLHQYGKAFDYCIPGMSIRDVCSYTLYVRNALGFGGVGYYPKMGSVHFDSGEIKKEWVR